LSALYHDVMAELHCAFRPLILKRQVFHRIRNFWPRSQRLRRNEGVDY